MIVQVARVSRALIDDSPCRTANSLIELVEPRLDTGTFYHRTHFKDRLRSMRTNLSE